MNSLNPHEPEEANDRSDEKGAKDPATPSRRGEIERLPNGKFAPGNRGGPGRPSKAREERYHEIAVSAVSPDEFRAITRRAVELAIVEGDRDARKWVTTLLLGDLSTLHVEVAGELASLDVDLDDEETAKAAHVLAARLAGRVSRPRAS